MVEGIASTFPQSISTHRECNFNTTKHIFKVQKFHHKTDFVFNILYFYIPIIGELVGGWWFDCLCDLDSEDES